MAEQKFNGDSILDIVDTLMGSLKNPVDPRDPGAFGAMAVKAQVTQSVFTGYQVLATLRLAEAIETQNAILEATRKTIASNG